MAAVEPLRKPVQCPNCNNNSQRETYPFCSTRCREADLHRWFSDIYKVESNDEPFAGED